MSHVIPLVHLTKASNSVSSKYRVDYESIKSNDIDILN